MSKGGFFGEALEMIAEEAGQAKKAVISQISGKKGGQKSSQPQQVKSDQGKGMPSESTSVKQDPSDPTKQFIKDLYGTSPKLGEEERQKKELEDKEKIEALRQRLHSQYYEQLVNPAKQQQPRPAEKLEQEEKEKEQKELEEKEKEPKPLPIVATKNMGTKEKLRGVSG